MRVLAAVLALLAAIAPAMAQGTVPGLPMVPLGYCQITSLSSAVKLTAGCTVPAGATMAYMRAEGANVRYRDDGTAPIASVGQLLLTTDPPVLYTGALAALSFIQAGSSATLDMSFYR